jgi:glycine/serine hydroxymethyltransferase
MDLVAEWIAAALGAQPDCAQLRGRVRSLCREFPLYDFLA